MSTKRPRDTDGAVDANTTADKLETHKRRKGFTVGPENLPDGTYRRKGTYIPQPFDGYSAITNPSSGEI
jgi:hypothetical protein